MAEDGWPIAPSLTMQELREWAPRPNMIPAQTGPTALGLPPQQLPFWLPASSPVWAPPPQPPPPAVQLSLMRYSGTSQPSAAGDDHDDLWDEMEAAQDERTRAAADDHATRLEAIRAGRETQQEPSASPRLPSPTPSPSKPSLYL